MDWQDQGLVLGSRRHGESSAIVSLFTRERGRHLGLARGGGGRRGAGLYQKGNLVAAHWRARLADQLGNYSCELIEPLGLGALDDAPRLEAVVSALAILESAMAEREVHVALFDATVALLRRLTAPARAESGCDWAAEYVRWECRCLADFGFGLDLTACAATGRRDDLLYVSPRSGRAVSAAAGASLAGKLLALPAFLAGREGTIGPSDVKSGLDLTQYFLERHVLSPHGRRVPAARTRMLERWRRLAGRASH